MPTPARHKEAPKIPSVTESVQSLIERKKHEKETQVSKDVSAKMAGTQEGVAEVLAGMEKPSEYVSERQGERGERRDIKGGKGIAAQAAQKVLQGIQQYVFPDEEVMVRQIRVAIEEQIDLEWKKAKVLQKRLDQGGAAAYNASIARIRKLKDLLASLLESTVDFLKNLYTKFFTPDGKKRKVEDI